MKNSLYIFIIALLFVACKPLKKAQVIEEAITKKDTTTRIIPIEKKIDSLAIVQEAVLKLAKKKIDFNTFYAKVKVDYTRKDGSDQATAFIRMKKDSIIWISLNQLGIEGYRLLVTPDSVFVMAKINMKWVQARSIKYLQEITELPVDFYGLQDLIIGNPIFLDNNIASYRKAEDNFLVLMVGNVFKHLLTLSSDASTILHSKLDDVDAARNRTCDITFSNYSNIDGRLFSSEREISVAEKSKLDVVLNFKQVSFNQPLTFPFSIPANYKRK